MSGRLGSELSPTFWGEFDKNVIRVFELYVDILIKTATKKTHNAIHPEDIFIGISESLEVVVRDIRRNISDKS